MSGIPSVLVEAEVFKCLSDLRIPVSAKRRIALTRHVSHPLDRRGLPTSRIEVKLEPQSHTGGQSVIRVVVVGVNRVLSHGRPIALDGSRQK